MPTMLFAALTLFASSVFGQDTGWCYSSLKKTAMTEPQLEVPPTPLKDIVVEKRHWLAMRAAAVVYKLPDLENTQNGKEFTHQFVDFVEQQVPAQVPGYEYFDSYSNRQSGLKFVILAPHQPAEPWILSFAGSETTIDWLADLNLARDQIKHIESMVKKMIDCLYIDNAGFPIAGKNWIITGHSLGGGLAQIFAYKVQSLRTLMRFTPGRIELVTFNGFGALELALPNAASAEIIVPQMLTSNYFVQGDIVSRIGKHVGNTVEIPVASAGLPIVRAAQRHVMGTVEQLLAPHGSMNLTQTRLVAAPFSETLNSLKGVGQVLGFLTYNQSDKVITRLQSVNTLYQAALELRRYNSYRPVDRSLITYLQILTSEFKNNLSTEVQTQFRDQLIGDLETILSILEKL